MLYSKTQSRLKFYMNRMYRMKKSVEAQEFFCMPSFDCFTSTEEKYIERKLVDLGILKLKEKGGKWNYEGNYFEKNKFSVDWNQLDVEYNGWLRDVPFVDLYKEWKKKPVSAVEGNRKKKYATLGDFKIASHINRRLREGITPEDIEEYIKHKYPLISEIERIQAKVADRLVTNAHCKITLEIEGDILKRIGFRPYQDGFNIKKGEVKEAFLVKHNLHRNPNGDIKSEIPRVTRLVHTGKWLPFSFDFYSQYLGRDEIPTELRKLVKSQAMPLYFTNWSSPAAFSNRQFLGLEAKWKKESVEKQTRRVLEMIKEGFDREVGESLKSLVFYYTSALEHYALEEVYDRYPGRIFQIFDEIYSEADIPDMEEIYERAALKLIDHIKLEEEFITIEDEINQSIIDIKLSDKLNFKPEELEPPNKLLAVSRSQVSRIDVDSYVVSCCYVDRELSLVSKLMSSNSSSSDLKFSQPINTNRRHGTIGRTWKLGEETKAKMRQPKSEETKAKMRQPKSEETKAKMRQPKSEETKAKISETQRAELQKQVEFVRTIMASETYNSINKTRAKQQYIDAKLVEKFGELSSTTLTKLRKLATFTSKEK